MNTLWQNFLDSQTLTDSANENYLYPATYLSVLKVSGQDAAPFLQGQLTCNVKELHDANSFFAGFCNAKGRVISTLLILKQAEAFLLILPTELFEKVKNKLTMHILRAKVQLENAAGNYGLYGVCCTPETALQLDLPKAAFSRHKSFLKLSHSHYLLIDGVTDRINSWSELLKHGLQAQSEQSGQWLDLSAGLAWLNENSSEKYIPQMLNLDKLGGVSFTKGCYTGQEVVARTHYLGQVKRELFVAECAENIDATAENNVLDDNGRTVGHVLTVLCQRNQCRLQVILQTDAVENCALRLDNANRDKICLSL